MLVHTGYTDAWPLLHVSAGDKLYVTVVMCPDAHLCNFGLLLAFELHTRMLRLYKGEGLSERFTLQCKSVLSLSALLHNPQICLGVWCLVESFVQ
jgi:hypothetical protein